MEIFIYAIIFITGTFFGSFFTLAVYRIPRKEDILLKHSYCPNCNSKLGFFDLFPVLSYIFLGGKCRYCKGKIRPRYLILELLSGLTFLILAIALKLNVFSNLSIINVVFLLIYVSLLFIIAGIDKENKKVECSVLIFGFIIEVLYIIYQYTLANFNVYQYVMYFSIFAISFFILNLSIKDIKFKRYILENLYLSLYMIIYSGFKVYVSTLILTLIIIIIKKWIIKRNNIHICYYLSISNILIIALSNIVINYII